MKEIDRTVCRTRVSRRKAGLAGIATAMSALLLSGCAAGVGMLGTAGSAALQAVGLGKPPVLDAQQLPRHITLALDAGTNLNAGTSQRGVALVVRLYALKEATSFRQAPFDTFLDPAKEQQVLGQDLLQVREVTLVPGQRYASDEKVPYAAGGFGIVALFRQPAMQRWRLTFDPKKSEGSGILVGMHACAMTVAAGTPIVATDSALHQSLNRLSTVHCQ